MEQYAEAKQRWKHISPLKLLALGFAAIILLGALLLMMPCSNRSGQGIPFLNALFTATSATCVTGLVVYDTYTQFTTFGQLVIMLLIQTGGLGFMTLAVLFALVTRKRIGLKERTFLMESVASLQLGGVVRLAKRILMVTFMVEGLGVLLLAIRFVPMFGVGTGLWYALFHAVSAFCNAGFDLMGRYEPYTSLVPFVGDALVILTISGLILIGGMGFLVWDDIWEHGWRVRRYRLHTKIVLLGSVLLVSVPYLLFLIIEQDGALVGLGTGERHLAALFSAVTPRTAGFNSVDTAQLTQGGALLTMLLMLVGGSSGSTAGGMKITTVAVLLLTVRAYVRQDRDVEAFGRRLEDDATRHASAASTMYLVGAVALCFLLTTQSGLSITDTLFEALSALGTVGMSRGITRQMNGLCRVGLILGMYMGRVGSLSVAMALIQRGGRTGNLRRPVEKIVLG